MHKILTKIKRIRILEGLPEIIKVVKKMLEN